MRGKKNLVIEQSLAGTIGLFVNKFSTLQEYGVDKVFYLENHNVNSTQRCVIFIVARREGEDDPDGSWYVFQPFSSCFLSPINRDLKVECLDLSSSTLCVQS